MKNKFVMTIDSKECNISVVRVAISAFVSVLDITVEDLMDIKTSVSEAVTNCIEHGYEGRDGDIIVSCKIDNNIVIIKVKDNGIGISDIELARTPAYTSKPELEHAGLGFTIMESFMDTIYIDSSLNCGTTITLIKEIKNKKSI